MYLLGTWASVPVVVVSQLLLLGGADDRHAASAAAAVAAAAAAVAAAVAVGGLQHPGPEASLGPSRGTAVAAVAAAAVVVEVVLAPPSSSSSSGGESSSNLVEVVVVVDVALLLNVPQVPLAVGLQQTRGKSTKLIYLPCDPSGPWPLLCIPGSASGSLSSGCQRSLFE